MRRIYKTTTAIVTCLSLVLPQLASAQDQQDQATGDQVILPEATEAAEPAPQPEAAAEETPAPPEQAPIQEQAPEQEQAAEPPQDPQEQAEPAAEAPAPKPPVTQAADPPAKPEVVEAAEPQAKPANAPEAAAQTEMMEEEAQQPPAAKPDTPDAPEVVTSEPAPEQEPAQEPTAAQAEQAPAPTPDADQLKKALEAEAAKQAPPKADEPQAAAPAEDGTAAQQAAPEQSPAPSPDQPQTSAQGVDGEQPADAPDAEELARRLQQQAEDQAQDAGPATEVQATEVQAPEATAKPNAVAQRAAEQAAPAAAEALDANAAEDQGQSDEVQITKENTRSSAEDFATSVAQGLAGAVPEATSDSHDRTKDIAKMLLAGAAGVAVGKMLSNDRQVALNTGDRVVVTLPDGSQQVIKDDNALLYQPGAKVRTENFADGSTRTTVLREDGSRVVTIRDANMTILRRTLLWPDGSETRLLDDTDAKPVRVSDLPPPPAVVVSRQPLDETALREALRREAAVDRHFSLGQIRDIPEVRALVAPVNVPGITFDTGSSAITPDQAQQLATLGKVIRDSVTTNPHEIYMIEGYTDAVGSDAANLALSDRRAESVALALTEYFAVPPENMIVQGYGEQFLLVATEAAERANRRVAVRRITDLLAAN